MGATVKRGAVQIPLLVGDKTGVWCASIRLIETEKHFLACFCPSEGGTDPSKHHDRNPLNFQNKGPEILVPPRSMVLKVVRGTILETLELSSFMSIGDRFRCGAWTLPH